MGREIRKVAKGWQHPKNKEGEYLPLYDNDFESAFNEWEAGRLKWISGEDPKQKEYKYEPTNTDYTGWYGCSPDSEYYRKEKWTEEEACCFQMYQNVSEGTPVSPVFDTLIELENWLVETQGHSRQAAHNFCESGYAPSMIMQTGPNGFIKMGVDACE